MAERTTSPVELTELHRRFAPDYDEENQVDSERPPEYEADPQQPPPYSDVPQKATNVSAIKSIHKPRRCLILTLIIVLCVIAIVIGTVVGLKPKASPYYSSSGTYSGSGYSGSTSGGSGSGSGNYYPSSTEVPRPSALPNSALAVSQLLGSTYEGILFYQATDGNIYHQQYNIPNDTGQYNVQLSSNGNARDAAVPEDVFNHTGIACRPYYGRRIATNETYTETIQVVFLAMNRTLVDYWLDGPEFGTRWRPGTLSSRQFRVRLENTCVPNGDAVDPHPCSGRNTIKFEPDQTFNNAPNRPGLIRLWGPGSSLASNASNSTIKEYYYDSTSQVWQPSSSVREIPYSYGLGGLAAEIDYSADGKSMNTTLYHTNGTGLLRYQRIDALDEHGNLQFDPVATQGWDMPQILPKTQAFSERLNSSIAAWSPETANSNNGQGWLYSGARNFIDVSTTNASGVFASEIIADQDVFTKPQIDRASDIVSLPFKGGVNLLFSQDLGGGPNFTMRVVNGSTGVAVLCPHCSLGF